MASRAMDPEILAMQQAYAALKKLPDARSRVRAVHWLVERVEIDRDQLTLSLGPEKQDHVTLDGGAVALRLSDEPPPAPDAPAPPVDAGWPVDVEAVPPVGAKARRRSK